MKSPNAHDIQLGLDCLKQYHNAALKFSDYPARASFDVFKSFYGAKFDLYCENIGYGIRQAGMTPSEVSDAMQDMADAARGKIPATWNDYYTGLRDQAAKINYLDVVKDTGKEILSGVQAGGNAIISTLSILTKIMPFVVVGAVLYVVSKKVKGLSGGN